MPNTEIQTLMHQAEGCVNNGQLEQALQIFDKICMLDHTAVEAWVSLGAIHAELGNLDHAITGLNKALHLQPDHTSAHFTLGHVLRAKGELRQAADCFRHAATYDPEDADAHFNLGHILVTLGSKSEALTCFQHATQHDPKHPYAWLMAGWCHAQLGHDGDAINAYQNSVKLDPSNAEAFYELANLQQLSGDIEGALINYQYALRLRPDFPEAHNNMGTALQAQGDFQAAIHSYQSALRNKPEFPEAHYNCGRSLEACRNLDAAISCYRQALAIRPDYTDAQHSLGSALTIKGEHHEAATVIRQVLGITDAEVKLPTFVNSSNNTSENAIDNSKPENILLATSLAPKNFENQRLAIESWLKLGFDVVSINSDQEIAVLKPEFPGLDFVVAKRNASKRFGKPYIYFDDILEYFSSTSGKLFGIINSDIHLQNEGLRPFLLKEIPESFVFGCRTDVDSLDDPNGQIYKYGFDYFFMDRKFLGMYPKDSFCIGLPWWDYWAPLVPTLRKIPLKQLTTPVALHITHPLNWNDDNYIEFAHIIGKYMGVTKPPTAVKRLGTYQNYAWILIDEYAEKISIP